MVFMATILLLQRDGQEHDCTAVSLWFSGRSSLYKISIMGILYRYYHVSSQNFTGQRNSVNERYVGFVCQWGGLASATGEGTSRARGLAGGLFSRVSMFPGQSMAGLYILSQLYPNTTS